MIPDAIVEEIKYRNDIEDVVSSYVTLKRAGSNLNGLCPFHSEKSPSFTLFTSSKNFYCFGCGAGGDVITFIMRAENLDYVTALEFLAKRAGIAIPVNNANDEPMVRRSRFYDMNREAAKFFHTQLTNSEVPLNYLKNRGISVALMKHFGLGYAPNDFGRLTDHLHSLGYKNEEMTTGFLCGISTKTKRPYDYFRGRIIFPIIDTTGNVIAFGGRVLDNSMPKYLNSSDTPVFKKSRNLYALNFAKNHCAESIILCEGYMDVIALHGAGFPNAVATLGTAITPEQARIMSRCTKSVIISYDSDEAGQRAADKAFRLLGEVGLDTRILKLGDVKDPDDYIKKYGATRFKLLLENSTSQFDFKLNAVMSKYNVENTDEKIKALGEVVKVIAEIYSEIERDIYIRRCAEMFDVSAESIKGETDKMRKKKMSADKRDEKQAIFRKTEGYGDRINPDSLKNIKAARAEEAILGMMLYGNEYIKKIRNGEIELAEADFFTEFNKRVFAEIIRLTDSDVAFDEGLLAQTFTVDEMSRIVKMKIDRGGLVNNDEIFKECINTLKYNKNDLWRKLNERREKG